MQNNITVYNNLCRKATIINSKHLSSLSPKQIKIGLLPQFFEKWRKLWLLLAHFRKEMSNVLHTVSHVQWQKLRLLLPKNIC